MTFSMILGVLSLLGYLALLGQAFWKTRLMSKDSWGLYDHGMDKMPRVVDWALKYCLNRGYIVIADRGSEYFIQFRKYILRNGEYGLELGFPEADWSKSYFPRLRDALTAGDIPFRETRESYGTVTAFIHVDCGDNTEKAVYLARLCLFDIFGLSPHTRFKSSPVHYSTVGEHVHDPDYMNPSIYEWWPRFRARWRKDGFPDPATVLPGAASTVGLLVCFPALWWSTFMADRSAPGWQWEIGSILLAGSHTTWVLLLVFCILLGGIIGSRRKIIRRSRLTSVDRIGGLLFAFGLPAAAIMSWLGL